jgi:hypothetical protein
MECIGVCYSAVECVLVVLGDSTCIPCAAVMSVYGVGSLIGQMVYVCCCLVFSSCSVSNIELCLSMYVSFICSMTADFMRVVFF